MYLVQSAEVIVFGFCSMKYGNIHSEAQYSSLIWKLVQWNLRHSNKSLYNNLWDTSSKRTLFSEFNSLKRTVKKFQESENVFCRCWTTSSPGLILPFISKSDFIRMSLKKLKLKYKRHYKPWGRGCSVNLFLRNNIQIIFKPSSVFPQIFKALPLCVQNLRQIEL